MRSANEGTDPVVKALTRGIVTVGAAAWAVNGKAAPSRIKLRIGSVGGSSRIERRYSPLHELEPRLLAVNKVTA